ncbi:MAG TPA: tetratricopeptide repeat protein [Flavisolibacter sp.]
MAEVKHQVRHTSESEQVIERAKDFWAKYGKITTVIAAAIIILGGGWLAYKYMVVVPKQEKAAEAIWHAEDYFAQDSLQKALKGDGQSAGFEKIASQYSGTDAGELANYYIGVIALKQGDNNKAIKSLKAFSTNAHQVQARAYKLLGDAYANSGKNSDALDSYKKAAHEFEKDKMNSSEYLMLAAYFADKVLNDKKQAEELYKEVLNKYPNSQASDDAGKYLAQMGIYKVDEK